MTLSDLKKILIDNGMNRALIIEEFETRTVIIKVPERNMLIAERINLYMPFGVNLKIEKLAWYKCWPSRILVELRIAGVIFRQGSKKKSSN